VSSERAKCYSFKLMTLEDLEDLLECVRGRLMKRTANYTVEEACLLQCKYRNAKFIKSKILVTNFIVLGKRDFNQT